MLLQAELESILDKVLVENINDIELIQGNVHELRDLVHSYIRHLLTLNSQRGCLVEVRNIPASDLSIQ